MSREMTSVYVDGQLLEAIESIAAESKQRDDVPEISKSEVKRRWLWEGFDNSGDLINLLSEEERILLERRNYIDVEGRVRNYRSGFRKRVADQFRERFQGGWSGSELDSFATNMIRDAKILWPEWSDEDYSEDRDRAISYVEALVEEAKAARDQSTYDPLDPEEVFSHYSGVEDGERRIEAEGQLSELIQNAKRMMTRQRGTSKSRGSENMAKEPDQAIEDLVKYHDVPRDLAERAVRQAALDPTTDVDPDAIPATDGGEVDD